MLLEVDGVSARVALSVLRKENAVGVVCPSRAGAPNVVCSEPGRKTAVAQGKSHVLDESAHAVDRTSSLHTLGPRSGRYVAPPLC